MAFVVAIPLVLAAALLQAALPQIGPVSGVRPDLALVLVVMAGMVLGFRQGLVLAFLSGLFLDFFSGLPFGFTTLLLMLVASVARFPNPNLLVVNPLVCMLVVALATLLYHGTYALGVLVLGGYLDWPLLATVVVLPSVIMNTLASPFVFGIFSLLARKASPVREGWP